jgi:uroporphyrinogen decarboxylase
MASIVPNNSTEARQMLEECFGNPQQDPLSPHDRVANALEHCQPDRVPFDFWAVPETIAKLKNYLNVSTEEEILQLLGVDCRIVGPDYVGPKPEILPDGTFYSDWGSHRRLVKNEYSTYEEYASFPLANAQSCAEVETWSRWPQPEFYDWSRLVEKIQAVNAKVNYHIRVDIGGIFESSWALYGLERFLIDLHHKPEIPCAIMDCYTDLMIHNVERMMAAGGGMVDMVYTYDDVAIQNGLLMSPAMWRKYILPRHQRLNKVIKQYKVKLLYHSCGAIYPLIGPLIDEMGIDVLNPLQPRARMMDMQRIKDEFGARVSFHGGIDLQQTLPFGTQSDVVAEVQERCNILGKGGGYICTSAHYLQADAPVENIIAMYLADRTVD